MKASYDLITQPWIPCLHPDGTLVELGLRDTVAQAHELQGLHDDSPPVVASLYRLLLALLHRVYGPEDVGAWRAMWEAGRFDPAPLDEYFAQWQDRFDLFHAERPFYQAADDRVKPKSIANLLPELSSGNNATLFDHTIDDNPPQATPPVAARIIVTAQTFGVAGLSGIPQKFTDCTCTRGAIFFAEGENLFQTLILNLPTQEWQPSFGDDPPEDRPSWEMDDPSRPDRSVPFGYIDYLTWPNRRMMLFPESSIDGPVIEEITVAPCLKMDPEVIAQDPMKLFRIDKKRGRLVQRFNENRDLWRDSAVLLRLKAEDRDVPRVFHWLAELRRQDILPANLTLRYMALGMAANQAKVEFCRSERMPLPLTYLDDVALVDLLSFALKAADDVGAALRGTANRLARLLLVPDDHSDRKPDRDAVSNLRAQLAIDRRYWSRLEIPFRQTMLAIPVDADQAVADWFDTLRQIAWDVFNQVADGLGDDPRALKAVVRARGWLAHDLSEALKHD